LILGVIDFGSLPASMTY